MFRRRGPRSLTESLKAAVWPLGMLIGLVFFSWLNSTHFDQTELRMLAEVAAYWKILSEIRDRI